MTTVNPYMDLGCVLEFFDTDEVLDDKYIMFNSMKETSLEEAISYDDKHFCIRNYEYIKLLFSLVGKLNDKYVSQLVKSQIPIREFTTQHKAQSRYASGYTPRWPLSSGSA